MSSATAIREIPGEHIYTALAQGALAEFLAKRDAATLEDLTGLPTPGAAFDQIVRHHQAAINNLLMSYTPYEDKREMDQSLGLMSFWLDSCIDALRFDHNLMISGDGSRYWWEGEQ